MKRPSVAVVSLSTVFLLALLSICRSPIAISADPPATRIDEASQTLMHAKLTRSQTVLEGLIRKDFATIARGAAEMKKISEAAEWPRARDSVYEHFSAEFRRQCTQLESVANERNHDGVMFTYLQMTTTCVRCHDYVRDSLRLAKPNQRGDVQLIPAEWPERGNIDERSPNR